MDYGNCTLLKSQSYMQIQKQDKLVIKYAKSSWAFLRVTL